MIVEIYIQKISNVYQLVQIIITIKLFQINIANNNVKHNNLVYNKVN